MCPQIPKFFSAGMRKLNTQFAHDRLSPQRRMLQVHSCVALIILTVKVTAGHLRAVSSGSGAAFGASPHLPEGASRHLLQQVCALTGEHRMHEKQVF